MHTNIFNILNKPVISVYELNIILAIDIPDDTLTIEFTQPIERIDIVFIAGMILLSKSTDKKFHFIYSRTKFDKVFEVRQYLKQYVDLYNDVLNISFQGITTLRPADYVSSQSFAPIVFVDANNIEYFFNITEKEQITNRIIELSKKYHEERLSGDNNLEEFAYLGSEDSVKSQLKYYPPIYTFVFSILFNKISPFVKSDIKGINDPAMRTEELWDFTKDYVKGLHELAKNIVEHSTSHHGMITIRVYDEESEDPDEIIPDKVLETHVFDFGQTGIIEQLRLETCKKKDQNAIYADDLTILDNVFVLKDLIKPQPAKQLNQQLYREIAHYGLKKFYLLIEKNQGLVVSATLDKFGLLDLYTNGHRDIGKHIETGTSYFFQLPFKHELFKTDNKGVGASSTPGSLNIINGLHELMDVSIYEPTEILAVENRHGKVLVNFHFKVQVRNRQEESELFEMFKVLARHDIDYFSIDMNEVSISSSSLLRLLAHLSTEYSSSPIIYNLDFEDFEEMIADNISYYEGLKDLDCTTPFWYPGKCMLIYSKLNDPHFNFADLLYGTNLDELLQVNKILSLTFPNSFSVLNETGEDAFSEESLPDAVKHYFFKASLLPFDLLLENEKNVNLFQTNLSRILSQELNTNVK